MKVSDEKATMVVEKAGWSDFLKRQMAVGEHVETSELEARRWIEWGYARHPDTPSLDPMRCAYQPPGEQQCKKGKGYGAGSLFCRKHAPMVESVEVTHITGTVEIEEPDDARGNDEA